MAGMSCGTRSYGSASLIVAIPHALPDRMQGRVRELVDVYTPEAHRGRGLASELLTRTVQEAQARATILMLTVDDPALERFYERFGFTAIQHEPAILMVRPVRQ